MMKPFARSLALVLALLPMAALAQANAPADPNQGPPPVDEIERGFYVGVTGGPFYMMDAPAPEGDLRPSSLGQTAQVEVGVDIGSYLSVGVFLAGTANRFGSDYRGFSGGVASGDLSMLVPGALIRVNAFGFRDSQAVKRTWIYVRAGAGYAMFSPRQLVPEADILAFGGIGLEYYTKLRHFSVGIEVSGSYLVDSGAMGLSVMPSLRYAF
ncbi:MAG TPA: adventurous gliding motility protein CglE [Myxococcaceae bacterium]|nr:adventurous gliding motility protein CglE [Myxococcaceae bacterium]